MFKKSRYHIALLVFIVGVYVAHITSCTKEYSYEAQPVQDSLSRDTIIKDSIRQPVSGLPVCTHCSHITQTGANSWNFKNGTLSLCGIVDTAIINPNRTGFTFFGPSACSKDTGFVMTVYLADTLNKSGTQIFTNRVAFYYYDNVTPSYIFMSDTQMPFTLTIEQYNKESGVTTGYFEGLVFTTDGKKTPVSSGRFSIVIK